MPVPERPQPRPGVLKIQAYVPGKSSAPGVARIFKLSSNESPLGPSPRAIEAYRKAGEHLEDYPDGAASDLRESIGRVYGLDPARIVQLHIVGYEFREGRFEDNHGSLVQDDLLELARDVIAYAPAVRAIILEWDSHFPETTVLAKELVRLEAALGRD